MVEEAVWHTLRQSAVGVIIKLKELDYTWSPKYVYYLLANQLAIVSSHEIWSLLEDQPVRFSLYEFGEITWINCDPILNRLPQTIFLHYELEMFSSTQRRVFLLQTNMSSLSGLTLEGEQLISF